MNMAADHNINFPHRVPPQSFCNRHLVTFGSGSLNSTAGYLPGGINSAGEINGIAGMSLTGNSSLLNNISSMVSASASPPNVKHRSAFSVDWTYEELEVLKQGLASHAGEPTIMKYIKIASKLPDKTVRDVAMRCRWMNKKENGKRRKPEDFYIGKKIKDRKEKMMGSFSMTNMLGNQRENLAPLSFMMYDGSHNNQFSCQAVPVIDSRTQHLLDDNAKLFHQIAVNLENNEIQNNIDLLYHSKENLTAILNSMSRMPGIMSQMPPLPIFVDENLMQSILPSTIQVKDQLFFLTSKYFCPEHE
ncbi:hypothetical protein Cni_G25651 [Canna indica]|uniref:Uncharacterized protein n=1 Tax=Canna indica TaxID=4628 RepID=A0AAQ3KXD9_9LILI|nr:hypothetical protein Cni_G25651 [Canna indica]